MIPRPLIIAVLVVCLVADLYAMYTNLIERDFLFAFVAFGLAVAATTLLAIETRGRR